jgi:RNA polymerase sigma factor (sigma-70 family)
VRVFYTMASTAVWEPLVEQSEEQELVGRAKQGDRDAAEELLRNHELLVFRTCRHLLPKGEDVDGMVQETMLRALRKLDSFSGQGRFASWLAAIAVNLCRDRLRRRRLIPFLALESHDEDALDPLSVLPSDEPNPERVAMARQAVARMRKEFGALPTRQKEVFALRFFAGLDLESIATALAVDLGTVKTHLFRATHRVRAAVEEARP